MEFIDLLIEKQVKRGKFIISVGRCDEKVKSSSSLIPL
jgi:hypothetical protein